MVHGTVAQLAEHRTFNPGVVGSSPTGPTLSPLAHRFIVCYMLTTNIGSEPKHREGSVP